MAFRDDKLIQSQREGGIFSKSSTVAAIVKSGLKPQVGDTVVRLHDQQTFIVSEVSPYGLKLRGYEGLFNPRGFRVHR